MKKLLIVLTFGLLLTLTNCTEQLPEVKENIFSAQDNSQAETHFFATFDAAYDVIATDKKFRKLETTIIPSTTAILFLDSSYSDGNGVSVIVDFGSLGELEPKGTLCQDGKYRAGKMRISVNQSIQSAEFRAIVTTNEEDSFYSGNGTDMIQLIGKTTISLTGVAGIRVKVSDAQVITDHNSYSWQSDRVIVQTKDNGDGIWGDEYMVTGSASGTNRDGEAFHVSISQPLMKRMEKGCAGTFISGIVKVTAKEGTQVVSINYDPFENEACDEYAEANLNGKKSIFKIK
ncbi:MAG: hypothetical protein ACI8SE_000631 [Bacteroidia bacterium]|jgi:hypothetical protein